MKSAGTFEQLVAAVGVAFASLPDDLLPDRFPAFLLELGLEELTDLSGDAQFQHNVSAAIDALAALRHGLDALSDALSGNDSAQAIAAAAAVLQSLIAALSALDGVAADLKRAAESTGPASSAADLAAVLVERVIEYALVCQLERTRPTALAVLELLTIVERNAVTLGTGTAAVTVLRRRAYLSRLTTLLNDPLSLVHSGYGWGDETLQAALLLERLGRLLLAMNVLTGDTLDDNAQPTLGLDLFSVTVGPTTDHHPPGLAANLVATTIASAITLYQPTPEWRVDLELDGPFQQGLSLVVLPPTRFDLGSPFTPAPSGVTLRLIGQAADASNPFLILGISDGSRFEAQHLEASVSGTLATLGSSGADVAVDLEVAGGAMVLTSAGTDGFLSQVLPGEFRANVDLGLTWSQQRGFAFHGGGGLDAVIPVGLSIGAITVLSVNVRLDAGAAGLQAEFSASVGLSLGPVDALVERIGVLAAVTFPDKRGNLAIADVALAYKPPIGAGLSIDAHGVVTGGGFLFHDPAGGTYAGVLQLSFQDQLTLTAHGLIATKMPDGSRGYSLLIFITAEGFKPIPLGFGFLLQSIGGIVAVNRTFNQDVIRAGLQSDTLATLLFPRDPVTNAPALIQALAAAFPAQQGSYLLGLVARITWFTPTLVQLDLALILEFGARRRLLVLARVSALLPSRDNDLIRLNMDALGVLDFDAGTLAIDAVLLDSRLAHKFPITGSAALRARWPANGGAADAGTSFVLAVGGLNPRFAPPAGFPQLERVAIALCSGSNPRLICDSYLAVSSNTVQFGAHASLYAEAVGFSVTGDLGFDALVTLLPPHFLIDFHASVQLKRGSHNLFKVTLDGTLEGPLPLRIAARAKFDILWFSFSVHFDFTLAAGDVADAVPAVLLVDELTKALADPASWSTRRAPALAHGVALRSLPAGTAAVLDPVGPVGGAAASGAAQHRPGCGYLRRSAGGGTTPFSRSRDLEWAVEQRADAGGLCTGTLLRDERR